VGKTIKINAVHKADKTCLAWLSNGALVEAPRGARPQEYANLVNPVAKATARSPKHIDTALKLRFQYQTVKTAEGWVIETDKGLKMLFRTETLWRANVEPWWKPDGFGINNDEKNEKYLVKHVTPDQVWRVRR